MPFKNVTPPRKVNDLNAEVRATAYLATPGLVAKLTADPVRLAVHTVAGAAGKVTNISLSGADDVALLSRDVAVVRNGDEVWALIDITHTPKMDQVARDTRALHSRATGEVALALGWDGSATTLTLTRHEVTARQFALRGTVRAADLGDNETYVVVDGAEGGQLRVHPGATPEPGASGRVTLPQAAAKLDRVRGGHRLSAVYGRRKSAVCVVTGGPGNNLTAKMIELEAPALEVAVFDTSLFVVFADGRVALYDGDAIARAGDAPAEPKSTVAAGGRGEPRTLLLSGKGSPNVWVGTSTGEVLFATAVRKAAL
jgi:hypothetical protein